MNPKIFRVHALQSFQGVAPQLEVFQYMRAVQRMRGTFLVSFPLPRNCRGHSTQRRSMLIRCEILRGIGAVESFVAVARAFWRIGTGLQSTGRALFHRDRSMRASRHRVRLVRANSSR